MTSLARNLNAESPELELNLGNIVGVVTSARPEQVGRTNP